MSKGSKKILRQKCKWLEFRPECSEEVRVGDVGRTPAASAVTDRVKSSERAQYRHRDSVA